MKSIKLKSFRAVAITISATLFLTSATMLSAENPDKKATHAESSYNGIYTDTETGLQWQDVYKNNDNIIQYLKWDEATQYCSSLMLDGKNWRLPTKTELRVFIRENKDSNLKALKRKNTVTKVNNYWTSTVREKNADYAWRVSILYRNTYYFKKSLATNVRCVRSLKK